MFPGRETMTGDLAQEEGYRGYWTEFVDESGFKSKIFLNSSSSVNLVDISMSCNLYTKDF